jgi:hypothetical protein
MPILAAVPVYYVGAAAFTSLAAAYAYINREGLSESVSDAYNYYTGNDELTTLEDLGIKTNESTNTYKTYDYAYVDQKDLTVKDIKDQKTFVDMSSAGYTGTQYVGQNVVNLTPDVVNDATIKPQLQELVSLEQQKNKMIQTKEWDKVSLSTKNFYNSQIQEKETNIVNSIKSAPSLEVKPYESISVKDRPKSLPLGSNPAIDTKPVVNAPAVNSSTTVMQQAVRNNAMEEAAPPATTNYTGQTPQGPGPVFYNDTNNTSGYQNKDTSTKVGTVADSDAVDGARAKNKGAKVENIIDDKQPGQNLLYDLEPATYEFTLSAISNSDYNTGQFDALADTNVVIKTSGLGKEGLAPGSQLNHHIRNMRLKSVVGLNNKTRVSNVHTLQFTVFEPFGTTLFNDLHDAAVAVGHPNYLKGIYLLTLRFYGMDDEGKANGPYGPKKFFPIRIINCNFNVTGGGTEYQFEAVPQPALTLADTTNKTTQPINLKGDTVGALLFDLQTQLNKQPQVKDSEFLQYGIRIGGGTASQSDIANQITAGTKDEILVFGADTPFQAAVMFSASINHDKFSQSANKVIEELNDEGKKLAQVSGRDTSGIAFGNKFATRVYTFNRGTSVLAIIQAIIDSSDYILRQTATEDVMNIDTNANGDVPWYKVDYKNFPVETDGGAQENKFYIIRPYYVDQYKAFPETVGGVKYNVKTIAREYNYIYTGENRDILDFDLQYNFAFFAAQAALPDNSPGGDDKRIVKGEVITQKYGKGPAGSNMDKGLVPVESKPSDVDDRGSTQGAERGDVTGYRASNIIKEQLSNPEADLLLLEMTILGDPFYLAQEDFNPNILTASETNSFELEDRSIDMNNGMVYLKINFKTPVDIDDESGRLAGLQGIGKYDTSFFSGFYQLIDIESNFEDGVFTQRLQMVRLRHQESENVQSIENNTEEEYAKASGAFDTNTSVEKEKTAETSMSTGKNGYFNQAFNKFVQAGAGGSGRNNPDSQNYVGPQTKTNITADNKIIGQS